MKQVELFNGNTRPVVEPEVYQEAPVPEILPGLAPPPSLPLTYPISNPPGGT